MREFQEKHKIVDLESQAKAVVASVAALNAQRISRKMELDYARDYSSPDEARARQLESQLSIVDNSLRDLERSRETGPAGSSRGKTTGMFPAALDVPALRAEFERIYRDRKVSEATLVFALDRLEGARAAEARDVSTFVVLDPPPLPTRRSRPRVLESLVLGGFLGLALSVALGYLEARRGARRHGVES
jgi:capsule polysaccharide export protein KpsE/RkpR